jgi:hypothetical protein
MNTTGCSPYYARDTFFVMDPIAASVAPCIVPLPLYGCFIGIYASILGLVAYSRTSYIVRRAYSGKVKRGKRGEFGSLQILTMTQSWLSSINMDLLLIVPLTYGTQHNVVIFLLGFQIFLFGVSSERWLTKLIRLGARIIGTNYYSKPKANQVSDSQQGSEEALIFEDLQKFDLIQRSLVFSVRAALALELLSFCLFCMVFPTARYWFLIGIGFQSYFTFACMFVIIHQYQRCKNAIIQTQKGVRQILRNPAADSNIAVKSVLSKFTRHQWIVLTTGTPGAIVLLLWAAEVIPINFGMLIVCCSFDVVVNSSMFLTFMLRGNITGSSSRPKNDEKEDEGKRSSPGSAGKGAVVVASDSGPIAVTLPPTETNGASFLGTSYKDALKGSIVLAVDKEEV